MTYGQLIEKTIVPANLLLDERVKKYEELIKYVNANIPSKLYRFRTVTERNISAFYNDELWFTNGRVMNDDFDARLYYDRKKLDSWLKSLISEDGNIKVLESSFMMNGLPKEILQMIPNAESIFETIKKLSQDQIKELSKQFIIFLVDNLETELMRVTDDVQQSTKYACFTEKIYSDMMWGQYSDNATGFALEYIFDKQSVRTIPDEKNNRYVIWTNIFPVLYGNKRIDTTIYAKYLFQEKILSKMAHARGVSIPYEYFKIFLPCPDEFMATKVAIKKSNDWKQEKEWRMFYTTNNPFHSGELYSNIKLKPSAVYLGRKISIINQKIICDIAKEKNIPVYKMEFNNSSCTYKLQSYKLRMI